MYSFSIGKYASFSYTVVLVPCNSPDCGYTTKSTKSSCRARCRTRSIRCPPSKLLQYISILYDGKMYKLIIHGDRFLGMESGQGTYTYCRSAFGSPLPSGQAAAEIHSEA